MAFQCKPGCGECCGAVPMRAKELKRCLDALPEMDGKIAIGQGGLLPKGYTLIMKSNTDPRCPFLSEERTCLVWKVRPEICRRFGIDKDFPCRHLRPDGTPRTEEEKAKIDQNIDRLCEKYLT